MAMVRMRNGGDREISQVVARSSRAEVFCGVARSSSARAGDMASMAA